MRRPGRVVLVAVAAAATAAAAISAAMPTASAATNAITNPGFETGNLSGWTCDASDSVVTGHAHSGTFALSGAAGNDTAQCAQTLNLVANTAYTLSAAVQGSYVFLGVSGGVSAQTWASGTGYQTLSLNFTTSSATSVTVFVHGWYGQGTYFADDVTLNGPAGPGPSGSPSTSRSPSGSPSPSQSPSPTPTPTPTGSVPPPNNGDFRNPIFFMPLENNPQNITDAINAGGDKNVNLAFVLDSGGCTPAWGGDAAHKVSSDGTVTGVVSAVRAKGGDVAVSFGGYNGLELGASCGGSSALANAYQQVISRYNLNRIDLDYEGDDLDANMGVRFGAIKILQNNARSAGRTLHVSLTIPMTTVGFPGSGIDELNQAKAAGVGLDIVNIMAFDYGLTNSGDQATSVEMVAQAAQGQLKQVFGWDDATAWAHLGLQIMNGHTDQPSELFTQATFQTLLGYARSKHVGWFSYWSLNRDRACDPSVPHGWADGSCSSVAQNPYDFTKIVAQYAG
ncbi:MAG: carbohydrate-binding protein [Actinobacteria bacterium 13_2_20CM_2_71_6]|nr:MAG: carbohydrate-binding protein [Actinobacteria bacterium 13_2_20CM_2_71_6]